MSRTFNRTRLELKLGSGMDKVWAHIAFNRTRLELKRNVFHHLNRVLLPFNRTRLELKPLSAPYLAVVVCAF